MRKRSSLLGDDELTRRHAEPAGHRRDRRCATGGSCATTRRRCAARAENPMTRAEVDAKSYDLMAPVHRQARARRLCDAVWKLERLAGRPQVETTATGEAMNRIVHLALKVEDLERTTEFYQKVFGFKEIEHRKMRDHISRHMTDGALDFTLMKYDAGTRVGGIEGGGRGAVHPSLRGRGRRRRSATKQIEELRLRDHQRPGRDPGEVPRAGRHRLPSSCRRAATRNRGERAPDAAKR